MALCVCRVVNETLESIALDLGFNGSTLAEGISCDVLNLISLFIFLHFSFHFNSLFFVNEGLVVSTCLGGAFIGSLFSGWIADGIGRRRAFQLCAVPMIIGASIRLLKYRAYAPVFFSLCV